MCLILVELTQKTLTVELRVGWEAPGQGTRGILAHVGAVSVAAGQRVM